MTDPATDGAAPTEQTARAPHAPTPDAAVTDNAPIAQDTPVAPERLTAPVAPTTPVAAAVPATRRVSYPLRRRHLTVAQVGRITPQMIRITLTGPELHGFASEGFDDHLKLVLPSADPDAPVMREYTPRRFDANTLTLDVVDHPGGPASDWARHLTPGDPATIAGPRGSKVIEGPIAHWLMIGDETALPAIARKIAERRTPVTAIMAVTGADEEQDLRNGDDGHRNDAGSAQAQPADIHRTATQSADHLPGDNDAGLRLIWLHRPAAAATDPAPYLAALRGFDIPPNCLIWIAAEAGVARAIRADLLARGHPQHWLRAAGYWVAGQSDASDKAIGEG